MAFVFAYMGHEWCESGMTKCFEHVKELVPRSRMYLSRNDNFSNPYINIIE
jgi:hypothetical protein